MQTLPDIRADFAQWYQEVVYQAELVDRGPTRGTMVIRPYGYAIWEIIQATLDDRIKKTGHKNAAFPLLIPESFLKREADHVEGFAPELAVVTHAGGKELEEPLIVRPTSETVIHYMFAQWIRSWRDLPLKINQWANVVRWEMRPRPFLRTTEFLWQEGHTAHETLGEADEEVQMMLDEYMALAHNILAIPAVAGRKSEQEKFPGAVRTMTFEALMQDGKALQMGTSHLLSQSFAHAFEMKFQDREGNLSFPYLTSWGATTRLIGAVVMVHGDEKGLVIPPRIAPYQTVIIPIYKKGQDSSVIDAAVQAVAAQCENSGIRVHIDADPTQTPGSKFYHWEVRGVPTRIEIGPRDCAQGVVTVSDRIGLGKEAVAADKVGSYIADLLNRIQHELFVRATARRDAQWHQAEKLDDFGPQMNDKPGFYQTGWCRSAACEEKLKQYQATTRCLLEDQKNHPVCFACNDSSVTDVLVAKAY